jgi:Tfp pilus assembly protein PilF
MIEQLEAMLANGQDNALLRYTLGSAWLKHGDYNKAIEHLQAALQHDPQYSAAWKSYARALSEAGHTDEAVAAYEQGIAVAETRGDKQAAREMSVFHKRLLKAQGKAP